MQLIQNHSFGKNFLKTITPIFNPKMFKGIRKKK